MLKRLNTRCLVFASSKRGKENADLKLDKDRLLGVLRRHKEAGLTDMMQSHRERLRKRRMTEKEVR